MLWLKWRESVYPNCALLSDSEGLGTKMTILANLKFEKEILKQKNISFLNCLIITSNSKVWRDVIKSHFEEKTFSSMEYAGRNKESYDFENIDLIFALSLTRMESY